MYFEEFRVGDSWTTGGRTVTEADIVQFAGLSGDFNLLHTDAEYAAHTPFGQRIAHGLLGLAVLAGLTSRLGHFDGSLVAFLGLEWRFTGPIFIGDTIRAVLEIAETRPTRHPERGVVIRRVRLLNQRAEVVQEGTQTFLIRRTPGGTADAAGPVT